MEDNGLSLENVFQLRGQAFSTLKNHAVMIASIGEAIESFDAALQSCIDCRSIDEQQALVTTARHLARLIAGGQA